MPGGDPRHRRAAAEMERIVDALMALTRYEAGLEIAAARARRPGAELRRQAQALSAAAEQRGLTIALDLPGEVWVYTDSTLAAPVARQPAGQRHLALAAWVDGARHAGSRRRPEPGQPGAVPRRRGRAATGRAVLPHRPRRNGSHAGLGLSLAKRSPGSWASPSAHAARRRLPGGRSARVSRRWSYRARRTTAPELRTSAVAARGGQARAQRSRRRASRRVQADREAAADQRQRAGGSDRDAAPRRHPRAGPAPAAARPPPRGRPSPRPARCRRRPAPRRRAAARIPPAAPRAGPSGRRGANSSLAPQHGDVAPAARCASHRAPAASRAAARAPSSPRPPPRSGTRASPPTDAPSRWVSQK